MSDFSIDASDLDRLATDLGDLAGEAHRNVRKAVEHTSKQIQDAWDGRLYTDGHAKYTGRAIDYTVTEGVLGVASDIGPRRGKKQAGIVSLLELGSVNNPPHGGGAASLEEALPDFEDRLSLALWAAGEEHGLT